MNAWLELFRFNRRLLVAVAAGVAILLAMQVGLRSSVKECFGIADSKEMMVSFESSVVLKKVYVIPGQPVRKGQPLLEAEIPEVELKILEIETSIRSLESEQKVREVLLGAAGSEQKKSRDANFSPLANEIEGLRLQLAELRRQKTLGVRHAQIDGVVATVGFNAGEQVPPLQPIITLTSETPNLVYGFINENLQSPFKVGDTVIIQPVTSSDRSAKGRVISIGSRITEFPERLQSINSQKLFFGREVMVSIEPGNQIAMGERVQIKSLEPRGKSALGSAALAEPDAANLDPDTLAENLPLEASGLAFDAGQKTLVAVSDDLGPASSPFWKFDTAKLNRPINLPMEGLSNLDDVESISFDDNRFFAMASLSVNKNGKPKFERRLLIRAKIDNEAMVIERSADLRTPLLKALTKLPVMQSVVGNLEASLDVESLTVKNGDAYIALKEPLMPDGSSVILKLTGLIEQLDKGQIDSLNADVFAILRLDAPGCGETARVSDLVKVDAGLFILGNCRRSEKAGGLWWLPERAGPGQSSLIARFQNWRPEGMAVTSDLRNIFLASDNGKSQGSSLIKIKIPALH